MNITIGSDHGAVDLKEEVKMVLHEFGDIHVKDVGTFGKEAVDYPDIAEKVCADVVSGGTGIGIAIAANKIDGIRAALCTDVYSALQSRRHNDANVLALGGRVTGFGPAGEIVRAWIRTEFEGGRHARRVEKTMALQDKKMDEGELL